MDETADQVAEVEMAWLLRNGDVLASVDVATTALARLRASAALGGSDAVLWCEGTHIAHSIGAHAGLDVAYLDASHTVIAVTSLRGHRIGRPRPGAVSIVKGRSGAFTHWNLQPGDRLELRE